MLFVSRTRDANTNKMSYRVIDGQQRLRAVFAYLENRFGANETKADDLRGKRFKRLPSEYQDQFMGYSFVVMEMSGYSETELRDIFARINKYVVRLNLQELRDAENPGPFKDFVDQLTEEAVWDELSLFSKADRDRKRDKEFTAELTVLLLDGPQDKKGSLDLYYSAAPDQFEDTSEIRQKILDAAFVAQRLLEGHTTNLFKKLPAFYGLMGFLFTVLEEDENAREKLLQEGKQISEALDQFAQLVSKLPANPEEFKNDGSIESAHIDRAYRFKESTSRQTDNVKPRTMRIEVLKDVITEALPPEANV
jgi:hypothetical protein